MTRLILNTRPNPDAPINEAFWEQVARPLLVAMAKEYDRSPISDPEDGLFAVMGSFVLQKIIKEYDEKFQIKIEEKPSDGNQT